MSLDCVIKINDRCPVQKKKHSFGYLLPQNNLRKTWWLKITIITVFPMNPHLCGTHVVVIGTGGSTSKIAGAHDGQVSASVIGQIAPLPNFIF